MCIFNSRMRSWVSIDFALGVVRTRTDRQFLFYSRPWIITPPLRKRRVKRIRDGVGRALLGLGGTLGFRSVSLALMAATWAGYHFISLHLLYCGTLSFFFQSAPFPSSPPSQNVLPLVFSFSLSLPFSFSLLYLFILLGRRPLFVPWRAGRLAARSSLDVAPSNTFALETAFDDVLLKRVYSALPRLEEERRKEGVSTWQVHTSLRSGPANFGYSPCQHSLSHGVLVPHDICRFVFHFNLDPRQK